MGKIPMLLATSVLAAVFGFLGAIGGVVAFADDLKGSQGPSGLQGTPGEPGPPGVDGVDGADGERGLRGVAGKAGKAPKLPDFSLGTDNCVGETYEVVTDVTMAKQKVRVSKELVCLSEAE